MGTCGTRSLAVGGSALVKAMDKVIAKGRKIAARSLEASEEDIEFSGGDFTVAGTDKRMNIAGSPSPPASPPTTRSTSWSRVWRRRGSTNP